MSMFKKYTVLALLFLVGCVGIPENVKPVNNFKLNNYLGKWYELARMDHSFEQGLSHVTAEYTLRDDGGVKVLNRGFDEKTKKWKEATGKAYFVEETDKGFLKVSFFGPFYGSYIVFDLDETYQYSVVSGPDKKYMWLLSRTPQIDNALKDAIFARAASLGFDTTKLIIVDQK